MKPVKKCVKCGVIIMYKTKSKLCHLCTPLEEKDVYIPRHIKVKLDKKEKNNEK